METKSPESVDLVSLESQIQTLEGLRDRLVTTGTFDTRIALEADALDGSSNMARLVFSGSSRDRKLGLAIEGIGRSIWEAIKKIYSKIADYFKRLWNWLTAKEKAGPTEAQAEEAHKAAEEFVQSADEILRESGGATHHQSAQAASAHTEQSQTAPPKSAGSGTWSMQELYEAWDAEFPTFSRAFSPLELRMFTEPDYYEKTNGILRQALRDFDAHKVFGNIRDLFESEMRVAEQHDKQGNGARFEIDAYVHKRLEDALPEGRADKLEGLIEGARQEREESLKGGANALPKHLEECKERMERMIERGWRAMKENDRVRHYFNLKDLEMVTEMVNGQLKTVEKIEQSGGPADAQLKVARFFSQYLRTVIPFVHKNMEASKFVRELEYAYWRAIVHVEVQISAAIHKVSKGRVISDHTKALLEKMDRTISQHKSFGALFSK
jgi:hypothetical protein